MYFVSHLVVSALYFNIISSVKPNIVVIITDDQDLVLGGVEPLKKTIGLLGNEGVTFVNAFSTTPVCCPSRSSILTGLYQHNHGVRNNSLEGNCNSFSWQMTHEPNTFAAKLHDIGYSTFYGGKYLNQYGYKDSGGTAHVPIGWDSWVGLVGNSKYYNFNLSINGTKKHLNDKYLTNVIREYGLEFMENQKNSRNPFLMVLAPPAPHHPFTPEPKYWGAFKGIKVPRNVQFNYGNNSDKHWLLQMPPSPLPNELLMKLDEMHAHRWESLLSVDDLISSLYGKLKTDGLLNNTYIIFTSDHGFHLGQFALPWDKRQPYEFDIRVPLMIRGPGIPPKKVIESPVLNIDIAPTLLYMGGVSKDTLMDGISMLPLKNYDRTFLIEYKGEGTKKPFPNCPWKDKNLNQCSLESMCKCQDAVNNTYTCIRGIGKDDDFIYCKFEDDLDFLTQLLNNVIIIWAYYCGTNELSTEHS